MKSSLYRLACQTQSANAKGFVTGNGLGLVSVPVKLYTAVRSHDVGFHQYNRETGARIRYRKVDDETGDEVDYGDIVKGWDPGDGRLAYRRPGYR